MFNIFKSSNQFDGKNLYNFSARNSNGENIDMSSYIGKVLLVVNVASQYHDADPSTLNFPTIGLVDENFRQLVELDKRYRNEGLVIIGFPTNQFGGREPALQQEIVSEIQRKYGCNFEIFEKVNCNGANTHPLFEYLKTILPGTLTNDLKWHFTKFLIDRNGNPVKRFAPNESPISFEEDIRNLLRQESSYVKGLQGQGLKGKNLPGHASLQGHSINQPLVRDQWNATHPSMMATTTEGLKKGLETTIEKGKALVGQASQKWTETRDIERDRAYWIGIEQDRLRIQREIGLGRPGMYKVPKQKTMIESTKEGLIQGLATTIEKGKALVGASKWTDTRDIERDRAYWIGIEQDRLRIQREIGLGKPGMYKVPKQKTMIESTTEGLIQGLATTIEKGKALVGQAAQKWTDPRDIERDRAYWIGIEQDRLRIQREGGLGKGPGYKIQKRKTERYPNVGQTGYQYQAETLRQDFPKERAFDQYGAEKQWPGRTTASTTTTTSSIPMSQHQGAGFTSQHQGAGFTNQGAGFTSQHQGAGFTNQGAGFTSQHQGAGFTNQGAGFTNQGAGFTNQGAGFTNQGAGFTNQGAGLTSQQGMGLKNQEGMGFKKQEDLTGEGGKVGAQMGLHLGQHTFQAGVQAGKDPQRK